MSVCVPVAAGDGEGWPERQGGARRYLGDRVRRVEGARPCGFLERVLSPKSRRLVFSSQLSRTTQPWSGKGVRRELEAKGAGSSFPVLGC